MPGRRKVIRVPWLGRLGLALKACLNLSMAYLGAATDLETMDSQFCGLALTTEVTPGDGGDPP